MSYLNMGNAAQLADELIETYPELLHFAEKKDFVSLNDFFLTQFARHNRAEFVWQKRFADSEEFLKEKAEMIGVPFPIIKKTAVLLTLHHRLDRGTLANMLKYSAETDEQIKDYIQKMESNGLLTMHYSGKYVCAKCDELTPEESVELDLFQSNPPLLINPMGHMKEMYQKMRRTIWSREADGTKEVPVSFLYAESSQTYCINYWLWENYLRDHPIMPEREEEDTDDEYKKKCEMAMLQHARKDFFICVFKKLGIENIWFLNFFDYRGRNYPIGYLFNPQGTDADKALLCFKPEPITDRGEYWLAVSIANQWNGKVNGKDLDKQDFKIRANWFVENIHPILENTPRIQEFLEQIKPFLESADSPACFLGQVVNMWEIYRARDWGLIPKVYEITHWDQTSSGYQFLGMNSGDKRMMKMTNLLGGEVQYDCYTILYQEMIRAGIPSTYTRAQMKKGAFIPGVYGSTDAPRKLFKNNWDYINIYNNKMMEYDAWQLSRVLLDAWKKDALEYGFHMPDGFYVYKVNKGTRKDKWNESTISFDDEEEVVLYRRKVEANPDSRELGTAIIHGEDGFNAREILRRCFMMPNRVRYLKKVLLHSPRVKKDDPKIEKMKKLLNTARKFEFYSLRLFELLTPSTVSLLTKKEKRIFWKILEELPQKSFQVSEIHDSFGVLPNYTDDLMEQERIIMSSLAGSQFLKCVLEEYLKTDVVDLPVNSPETIHLIRTQGRILA